MTYDPSEPITKNYVVQVASRVNGPPVDIFQADSDEEIQQRLMTSNYPSGRVVALVHYVGAGSSTLPENRPAPDHVYVRTWGKWKRKAL